MKVFITGILGSVGTLLEQTLKEKGFEVFGNDIKKDIKRNYLWKATEDLTAEDLAPYDVIIYASEPTADRPLGNASPSFIMTRAFLPLHRVLSYFVKNVYRDLKFIYLSSFNALYGNKVISLTTRPSPTNFYGWMKASEELLVETYKRMYPYVDNKLFITRVSSAYGPGMRLDEMIAQMIIQALTKEYVVVRSPFAKRIWTYNKNVAEYYVKFLEEIDSRDRFIYHLVGDKDFTQPLTNLEIAKWILDIIGYKDKTIGLGEIEQGEENVDFTVEQDPFWNPQYTFEEGIKATLDYVKNVLDHQ
ncbi:MAG: NAD(P)-dependent oxidoreductase [Saccharolobus sp.]|uniref:NAD-dependent epimerase/dehydratase family protein n=1 Tax=Saccharolobus sp. TaxID=2100761 RepID=UPI00316A2765